MATSFQSVTAATESYSTVVLAKGPAGYWRLGETGGTTAADTSGNGADGASATRRSESRGRSPIPPIQPSA